MATPQSPEDGYSTPLREPYQRSDSGHSTPLTSPTDAGWSDDDVAIVGMCMSRLKTVVLVKLSGNLLIESHSLSASWRGYISSEALGPTRQ